MPVTVALVAHNEPHSSPCIVSHIDSGLGHETNFGQCTIRKYIKNGALISTLTTGLVLKCSFLEAVTML